MSSFSTLSIWVSFKGSIRLSYEKGEERAVKLVNQINELKKQVVENGWFDCKGVYQFFSAAHEGNTLNIYDPNGGVLKQVNFPRQSDGEGLCCGICRTGREESS